MQGNSAVRYISFRKNDGSWTQASNMGERINSADADFSGTISPDGKFFFYARTNLQTRKRALYWVSASILEDLRPKELRRSPDFTRQRTIDGKTSRPMRKGL